MENDHKGQVSGTNKSEGTGVPAGKFRVETFSKAHVKVGSE